VPWCSRYYSTVATWLIWHCQADLVWCGNVLIDLLFEMWCVVSIADYLGCWRVAWCWERCCCGSGLLRLFIFLWHFYHVDALWTFGLGLQMLVVMWQHCLALLQLNFEILRQLTCWTFWTWSVVIGRSNQCWALSQVFDSDDQLCLQTSLRAKLGHMHNIAPWLSLCAFTSVVVDARSIVVHHSCCTMF